MDSTRANVTRQFQRWFERPDRQKCVLRLFIAGMTLRSSEAVARIKKLCDEHLAGRYELEIVDIYQQPALAKEFQVLAVPTLMKLAPGPARYLIGDFSDTSKVLRSLDIRVKC